MWLVMAEFGPRKNAGDAKLDDNRLEPALSTALATWGDDLRLHLLTDQPSELAADALKLLPEHRIALRNCTQDDLDFAKGPRRGWRLNDFYKVRGLMQLQDGEVGIALDADMAIVDPARARSAAMLGQQFGLAVACNARWMVGTDADSQCDGGPVEAWERDAFAFAGMPIIYHSRAGDAPSERGWKILAAYVAQMKKSPARGPLVMWRASMLTRCAPLILPPQWCITAGLEDLPHPIIAHVGHRSVAEKFKGKY